MELYLGSYEPRRRGHLVQPGPPESCLKENSMLGRGHSKNTGTEAGKHTDWFYGLCQVRGGRIVAHLCSMKAPRPAQAHLCDSQPMPGLTQKGSDLQSQLCPGGALGMAETQGTVCLILSHSLPSEKRSFPEAPRCMSTD